MPRYIVNVQPGQEGGHIGQQRNVYANSESEARQRGADLLGVGPSQVEVRQVPGFDHEAWKQVAGE